MTNFSKKYARCWLFTLNHPVDEDIAEIEGWDYDGKFFRFSCGQEEVGDSGTPHFQGYVEVRVSARLSKMRKLLRGVAHWEPRRGSQNEAIDYCTKRASRSDPGYHWYLGVSSKSKCSGDLCESVFAGAKLRDIAEDFPQEYIRMNKGIRALREIVQKPRCEAPEVFVFWGATGTGKSYSAWNRWPKAFGGSWPSGKGSTWWWDHYDHEETVIFDEFKEQVSLQTMLQFLDRYSFNVQFKGGYVQMNSPRIVICSNMDPDDWYNQERSVLREALFRRLKEYATVYEFTHRTKNPVEDPPVLVEDPHFIDAMEDDSSDLDVYDVEPATPAVVDEGDLDVFADNVTDFLSGEN